MPLTLNRITETIIGESIRVHQALGPGLLESVYELVLAARLNRAGLRVERQKSVAFEIDGIRFEDAFRIDLLVENAVIVEIKSVEKVASIHLKQILTYLRLTDLRVGLVINFGAETLKDGLHRVVNGYDGPD